MVMLATKNPSRGKIVLSMKHYKEMQQAIAIAEYERDKACGRLKSVKSLAAIA
jgi:hypothetical protein